MDNNTIARSGSILINSGMCCGFPVSSKPLTKRTSPKKKKNIQEVGDGHSLSPREGGVGRFCGDQMAFRRNERGGRGRGQSSLTRCKGEQYTIDCQWGGSFQNYRA